MRKSIGIIPSYITALSLNGLRRSMLKTQLRLGYGVNFFDMQFTKVLPKDKNEKWVAFYYSNEDINSRNIGVELAE